MKIESIKNFFFIFLNILVGFVFILSSFSKALSFETFEFNIVDSSFLSWEVAPFIARLLVGFEFFLGFLFILNIDFFKIRNKLTYIILILFSAFLVFQIMNGNKEDCGCFGTWIVMTPFQALIKNLVLIYLIFIARNIKWNFNIKASVYKSISILVLIICLVTPFVSQPIELNYSRSYLTRPNEHFTLPLDTLYNNYKVRKPNSNLKKGKHILAFLSLKCPHCIMAAKKIGIFKRKNPDLPFFMILNGKSNNLTEFVNKTNTHGINYTFLKGKDFIYLAGLELPVIYLIDNSKVEIELNYKQLNQNQVSNWLKK